MEQMRKGESKRQMKVIAEKQLLELELKLIYALDFTPHKVELRRAQISEHKKTFAKYLTY